MLASSTLSFVSSYMRFGLISNVKRPGAAKTIKSFIAWAQNGGHELHLSNDLKKYADDNISISAPEELAKAADIVVSMGGDGTLLATARAIGAAGTPMLGINHGSLGFLTQHSPKQLTAALDAIVSGEYEIEERMMLAAKINGGPEHTQLYALNDVVIDRGVVSRLIEINFRVNGEEIVTYRADGMVVATPTGSTAYALAVGGPIMHPKLEAMIACPISSFSLSTRPMLFGRDDMLELTVVTGDSDRDATLTLDGQVTLPMPDNSRVVISRAEFTARFVRFPGSSFYKVLRNKLHWGLPPRTGR